MASLEQRIAQWVDIIQRRRRELERLADAYTRSAKKRAKMKEARAAGRDYNGAPVTVARLVAIRVEVTARKEAVVTLERTITRNERKLDKLRASRLDEDQALAVKLLRHRNSIFAFSSPTGGTARAALEAQAEGKPIPVAATGKKWQRNEARFPKEMLRYLIAVCDKGRCYINCLTNGRHMNDSDHYALCAADIDKGGSVRAVLRALYTFASRFLANVLNEDAYHYHISWARRLARR